VRNRPKAAPVALSAESLRRDRERAFELCPRLRPVASELETYSELLRKWQGKINLVSEATLAQLWTRHFADSAQVLDAAPDVATWADLGSGAGFPGMVIAICLKGRPGAEVHLIESDQRKAAFLRAVSRETGAPAQVHPGRIEIELPKLAGKVRGVTARGVAPLSQLLAWSNDLLLKNAVGVFLKGEDWRSELTQSQSTSNFHFNSIPSRTNPLARLIVAARDLQAIEASQCPHP
jgi:16S rRNA (guanine527-N7)-methyltransferase